MSNILELLAEDASDALDDRQAFMEERAHVIGSTDSAGILRLSRRSTPLSVYRRLTGGASGSAPNLPAWLGIRLENVVAELASHATGYVLRADNRHHVHPHLPYVGCHLDRRVVRSPWIIVELKTRSRRAGWGPDGSTQIPPDIYVQVQHQLMVTGAREVLVATLFGLRDFAVYAIPRNDAFIAALEAKLVEFHTLYIEPGVPPPATGLPEDTAFIQSLPGGRTDAVKPATPEQEGLVRRYALARLNAAQADVALEETKNQIKQLIGEAHDGLMTSMGTVWYRRTKDGSTTEWDLVAGVYRRAVDRLLEIVAPGDDDELVSELAILVATVGAAKDLYTKPKQGVRRLTADDLDDAAMQQLPALAPPTMEEHDGSLGDMADHGLDTAPAALTGEPSSLPF